MQIASSSAAVGSAAASASDSRERGGPGPCLRVPLLLPKRTSEIIHAVHRRRRASPLPAAAAAPPAPSTLPRRPCGAVAAAAGIPRWRGTLVGVAQIADTTDEARHHARASDSSAATRCSVRCGPRTVSCPVSCLRSTLAPSRHPLRSWPRVSPGSTEAPRLDHDPPHLPADGAALLQQYPQCSAARRPRRRARRLSTAAAAATAACLLHPRAQSSNGLGALDALARRGVQRPPQERVAAAVARASRRAPVGHPAAQTSFAPRGGPCAVLMRTCRARRPQGLRRRGSSRRIKLHRTTATDRAVPPCRRDSRGGHRPADCSRSWPRATRCRQRTACSRTIASMAGAGRR